MADIAGSLTQSYLYDRWEYPNFWKALYKWTKYVKNFLMKLYWVSWDKF